MEEDTQIGLTGLQVKLFKNVKIFCSSIFGILLAVVLQRRKKLTRPNGTFQSALSIVLSFLGRLPAVIPKRNVISPSK